MSRLDDLVRFYSLLDRLGALVGGPRLLADCHGRMGWPLRGVYFFFEDGETRSDSGVGKQRVVRVGTHALRAGSKAKLWSRLSQHRGVARTGGGNHRGSIFRLLVGASLMGRDPGSAVETWGVGNSAKRPVREAEHSTEVVVSRIIGAMPCLWIGIEDEPGPQSLRGLIERGAIALLSNSGKPPLDPASPAWLGRSCPRDRVVASDLWNQEHVAEAYDPGFLDALEELVERTPASGLDHGA